MVFMSEPCKQAITLQLFSNVRVCVCCDFSSDMDLLLKISKQANNIPRHSPYRGSCNSVDPGCPFRFAEVTFLRDIGPVLLHFLFQREKLTNQRRILLNALSQLWN